MCDESGRGSIQEAQIGMWDMVWEFMRARSGLPECEAGFGVQGVGFRN